MDWVKPTFKTQIKIKRRVNCKSNVRERRKVEDSYNIEEKLSNSSEDDSTECFHPSGSSQKLGTRFNEGSRRSEKQKVLKTIEGEFSVRKHVFETSVQHVEIKNYNNEKSRETEDKTSYAELNLICDSSPDKNMRTVISDISPEKNFTTIASDRSPINNIRTITFSPLNSERKKIRVKNLKAKKKLLKNSSPKMSDGKSGYITDEEDYDSNCSPISIERYGKHTIPLKLKIIDESLEETYKVDVLDEHLENSSMSQPQSPDIIDWFNEEKKCLEPVCVVKTDESDEVDILKESTFEEHPLQTYYKAEKMKMGLPRIEEDSESSSKNGFRDFSPIPSPEEHLSEFMLQGSLKPNSNESSDDDVLKRNVHYKKFDNLTSKLLGVERRVKNNLISFSYELEAGLLDEASNQTSGPLLVEKKWEENSCLYFLCIPHKNCFKSLNKHSSVLDKLILSTAASLRGIGSGNVITVLYPVLAVVDTSKKTTIIKSSNVAIKLIKNNEEPSLFCNEPTGIEEQFCANAYNIANSIFEKKEDNERIYIIRRLFGNKPRNLLDAFANCLLVDDFCLKIELLGKYDELKLQSENRLVGIDEENNICTILLLGKNDEEVTKDFSSRMAGKSCILQSPKITKVQLLSRNAWRASFFGQPNRKNVGEETTFLFHLEVDWNCLLLDSGDDEL